MMLGSDKRNAVFLCAVCVLLALPASSLLFQRCLGGEYSNWLTGERVTYLVGGIQGDSFAKSLSVDGFVTGHLQGSLEGAVAEAVPARDAVLLADAAIERRFIAMSNALFCWDCYPTFYGSDRLYIPENDAQVRMPDRDTGALVEGIRSFGQALSEMATTHLDKDFVVVIPDMSETSSSNPAMHLVSDPLDSRTIRGILEERLAAAQNVSLVTPLYEDADAYFHDYYSTDHHWNGFGAYRAYLMSEAALGREEGEGEGIPGLEIEDALDGLIMNGSLAREGLMLLNEPVREPHYGVDDLVVEEGDIPALMEGDSGVSGLYAHELRTEFDFYHIWYGPSSPNKLSSAKGNGNALLVCDSFGSALRWCLGMKYENTSIVLDLYGSSRGDETLAQRIKDSAADVVYLNASAYNISRFTDRYPRYFDE